jgi:hypothetical protein
MGDVEGLGKKDNSFVVFLILILLILGLFPKHH